MSRFLFSFLILALSTTFACGGEDDDESKNDFEGDEAGECSDDADNDRDGEVDCDDPDCAGTAHCSEVDQANAHAVTAAMPRISRVTPVRLGSRKR